MAKSKLKGPKGEVQGPMDNEGKTSRVAAYIPSEEFEAATRRAEEAWRRHEAEEKRKSTPEYKKKEAARKKTQKAKENKAKDMKWKKKVTPDHWPFNRKGK